jgi:hypothetical protein
MRWSPSDCPDLELPPQSAAAVQRDSQPRGGLSGTSAGRLTTRYLESLEDPNLVLAVKARTVPPASKHDEKTGQEHGDSGAKYSNPYGYASRRIARGVTGALCLHRAGGIAPGCQPCWLEDGQDGRRHQDHEATPRVRQQGHAQAVQSGIGDGSVRGCTSQLADGPQLE